jgi:hypothetical protein
MAQADIVNLSTKPDGTFNWGASMRGAMSTIADAGLESFAPGTASLFVPARAFQTQTGSPAFAANTNAGSPHWSMPDSSTTVVTALVPIPAGWATFDWFMWSMNLSAATGDVVLNRRMWPAGNGVAVDMSSGTGATTPDGTGATFTAGANLTLVRSSAVSGVARPALGFAMFSMRRNGADAADTLAGAFGFVAYELVRAS